jgi:anti-sigma regulatory factor (Ser/Thr protein kinase)/CheY-like chemotaxis protein
VQLLRRTGRYNFSSKPDPFGGQGSNPGVEATMGRVLIIGKNGAIANAFRASTQLRDHEIHTCGGGVEGLRIVRDRMVDVVLTDPETSVTEDLALAEEFTAARPGIRIIVLAPAATHEDLMAALKAHVFACFTAPFDINEVVDMVRSALSAPLWRDDIEVISSLPHWLSLRVSCHLLTADRLVSFMASHLAAVADEQRDLLMAAFREMLLNAMEHGAAFDSEKVIEVTAARTARALVYHFRDPGSGFDRDDLAHAAASSDPDAVLASAMKRAELGLRPGGFGMLIARQVADELVYNERGNEVLMIKHLDDARRRG